MSIRPFEYHTEAIAEAHEAFHWYAQQSSDAAKRFWDELIRVAQTRYRVSPRLDSLFLPVLHQNLWVNERSM